FRSKKQPGTKRSIGIGIINPIDTCARKTRLVKAKKMFVAAEAMKKDVFAIFPARLFHFRHLRDSHASDNQRLLDLGSRNSQIIQRAPATPKMYSGRCCAFDHRERDVTLSGSAVSRFLMTVLR